MAACEGSTWDVVGASSSLSQLAGVIAGFVFAGTIVLLSQPRPTATERVASARLRALAPFFAAFVAMGLNAYVFALLGGEEAAGCRRVWTGAVAASGMLGVGVVSAICGIMLLVRAYLAREHLSGGDERHLVRFERLLESTLFAFCFIVPALLLQRVYEFLRVWYGGNLHGFRWVWLLLALLGVVALFVAKFPPRFVRILTHGPQENGIGFFDTLWYRAAIGTVFYSIAATAAVGFFLGVIPTAWEGAPAWVPWSLGVAAIVIPSVVTASYYLALKGIRRELDGQ